MEENRIARAVIDLAIQIHRELGPGLLESIYESVLMHELRVRGFEVHRQVAIPIRYRGIVFDEGFRADILVQEKVLLELKSVSRLHPGHRKQLLSYLRLSGLKLGILLNFSENLMRNGIHRLVNRLPEEGIEV